MNRSVSSLTYRHNGCRSDCKPGPIQDKAYRETGTVQLETGNFYGKGHTVMYSRRYEEVCQWGLTTTPGLYSGNRVRTRNRNPS